MDDRHGMPLLLAARPRTLLRPGVRRLAMLTCVLLLLAWAPTAQAQQTALEEARAELSAGRPAAALLIVDPYVTQSPDDADALLLRARAREAQGQSRLAAADYERVLALDDDNEAARQGLRRTRLPAGSTLRQRYADVQNDPDDLTARLRLAEALFEAGQYRAAADEYERYLDDVQGNPAIVQRYLVALANYEGDNARGEAAVRRYLQFYPTSDDLYMRLGYFLHWQNEHQAAEEAFQQALLLNPGNQEARRGLAMAQNPAAARAASTYPIDVAFRELREDPGQDELRFDLVRMLVDAGRFSEAQQQLRVLASSYRDEDRWQRLEAVVSQRLATAAPRGGGGPTFVVDRLQRQARQNPDNPDLRFQLAAALLEYDRFYEAYEQLQALEEAGFGESDRWLRLFVQADEGLIASTGTSPLYVVDRLTFRLRAEPSNADVRYQLVEALADEGRLAEAYDVLTERPYAVPEAPRYQRLLARITAERERLAAEQVAHLQARLDADPADVEALEGLIRVYVELGRSADALALYERLLEIDPNDAEARYRYAQLLRELYRYDAALDELETLLTRDMQNRTYQRTYALTAVSARIALDEAEDLLEELLEESPQNADLLLDLAEARLQQAQPQRADSLLRVAYRYADYTYEDRIETLSLLTERELVREERERLTRLLNDARRLAQEQQYRDALQAYEVYFSERGRRTRSELFEVAQVYSTLGEYKEALSIFEALQEQLYTYNVAKEIARVRYYMADQAGALLAAQELLDVNPDDFEARLLLAQIYQETGRLGAARELYADADRFTRDSEFVDEQIFQIDSRRRLDVSGGNSDYAGIFAPVSQYVHAYGGSTEYERWAQGLQGQVTFPFKIVGIAGITSHFYEGTRRLVADSEREEDRVNQVIFGAYRDFGVTTSNLAADYTNRLTAEAGLFDYQDGRTVPFFSLRYLRQDPGLYTASIGLRRTEGAIELWAPIGNEIELRLTQLDVRGFVAPQDSLLRFRGTLAFNGVSDTTTASDVEREIVGADGTNNGVQAQLEGSIRVLRPSWFVGSTFYYLGYEYRTNYYFSPQHYRSYDFWLEYERQRSNRLYARVRAGVGFVGGTEGVISRRIEGELTWRIFDRLSAAAFGSLGRSSRPLSDGLGIAPYTIATFSGALYLTL